MKELKKLRLTINFCKVFATAFAVGMAFSFVQIFWPYSDRIMAFLLMVFCTCATILLNIMATEFENRYKELKLENGYE